MFLLPSPLSLLKLPNIIQHVGDAQVHFYATFGRKQRENVEFEGD